MSFKYINPGYTKLINVINEPSFLTQLVNSTISKTGVSFYNSSNYDNYIKIDNTHASGDLWAKCDFYWDSSQLPRIDHFGEYNGTSNFYNGLYTTVNYSRITYQIVFSGSYQNLISFYTSDSDLESSAGLRKNSINTFWLHLHYGDSSSGYIELKINNKNYGKITGNVTATSNARFTIRTSYMPISSVIISDEEINPNEKIVLLPVSSTVTDMESLTGGLYVADTASETLLQSVNTTSLFQEYGSDSKITGIALIGNPAYEVDDVIGSLTSLSKQNGVVTDHDNITLLTDSDAMIVSSFSLPTDTTVADLSNYQFGWRAEE